MKRNFATKTIANGLVNWYREVIRHPQYRWWIVLGSLIYLLNPFDILPDVLPIVGLVDDGLLASILVAEVAQVIRDRRKSQPVSVTNMTAEVPPTIEVQASRV